MVRFNTRCSNFIGSKVQELIQHGISVHLTNGQSIDKRFSGTFCGVRKEFRVAMGDGDNSLFTFIHEYAHFLQYKFDHAFWHKRIYDGVTPYFDWLAGAEYSRNQVKRSVRSCLELEHNCEIRVQAIIDAYSLRLDKASAATNANANLMGYVWGMRHRIYGPMPITYTKLHDLFPGYILPIESFTNFSIANRYINIIDS